MLVSNSLPAILIEKKKKHGKAQKEFFEGKRRPMRGYVLTRIVRKENGRNAVSCKKLFSKTVSHVS